MRQFPFRLLLFASCCLAACGGIPATSVTVAPDGPQLSRVDDSLYAHTLAAALDSNGVISLSALRQDEELTEYLGQIARMRTDVFVSRQAALTFWLNTHNAYVLDLLRNNHGARSVDDISGFRYAKIVLAGGERYSLDDIEHSVLTKQFREPRAFFALWDGARSSPKLAAVPYAEEHLSDQLNLQVTGFLADSTKNYLNKPTNTLYLSDRFHEYRDDIEKITNALSSFVRAFAAPPLAEWMDRHSAMKISYLSYDYTIRASDIDVPRASTQWSQPARKPAGGIR